MHHGFIKAYAKLNLTLDVLGCRDDGYHELEMVMQSISLCDSVAVRIGAGEGVSVISNIAHIPNDERNIAVKAAKAFSERFGNDCGGIAIAINKRIPSSAGMAGGSADGAAVLRLLNELNERPFSEEALCDMGLTVGADVPFCIMGGTRLAKGKGEAMRELSPIPGCSIVVCKPRRGMSTKDVFGRIDGCTIEKHPDTKAMLDAIEKGDLCGISRNVYNVFEPIVAAEVQDVEFIKSEMLKNGALVSAMTGSGSAVFGIYDDETVARNMVAKLKGRYTDVFLTHPVSSDEVKFCEV